MSAGDTIKGMRAAAKSAGFGVQPRGFSREAFPTEWTKIPHGSLSRVNVNVGGVRTLLVWPNGAAAFLPTSAGSVFTMSGSNKFQGPARVVAQDITQAGCNLIAARARIGAEVDSLVRIFEGPRSVVTHDDLRHWVVACALSWASPERAAKLNEAAHIEGADVAKGLASRRLGIFSWAIDHPRSCLARWRPGSKPRLYPTSEVAIAYVHDAVRKPLTAYEVLQLLGGHSDREAHHNTLSEDVLEQILRRQQDLEDVNTSVLASNSRHRLALVDGISEARVAGPLGVERLPALYGTSWHLMVWDFEGVGEATAASRALHEVHDDLAHLGRSPRSVIVVDCSPEP